jgi:opacity protein-like surface antigen
LGGILSRPVNFEIKKELKKMKKLFTIILLSIFAVSLHAGDVSRKGTTGAEQLLIPVGARGLATGSAFVANLTGLESIYYNPAGLDVIPGGEAMFSYMNYIADINVSYFGASTTLGDIGSIALTFKTFDFGDIPITTADFPDGDGRTYSPSFLTFGLTYSKLITDRISIGTSFKFISESIQNTTANGFAIDFGVQYKFDQQLSIGAALMNIGGNMQYAGPELQQRTGISGSNPGSPDGSFEIVSEQFQIPSYFQLSVAYDYNINEQNNLIVGTTFIANNSLEDLFNFGLEYGFVNTFFVRGGYNLLVAPESDNSIYGFTAGAGIAYDLGGDFGIVFDYAYRDVKEFPSSNHMFTVKMFFQ